MIERWALGPPPGVEEEWRNWAIVAEGRAVGHAQATVRPDHALVAWVVLEALRGRGYATAAARAMIARLPVPAVAHIHPSNLASEAVAAKTGLILTDRWAANERVWSLQRA